MRSSLVMMLVVVAACQDDKPAAPASAPPLEPAVRTDPYAEARDRMVRETIEGRGLRDEHVLAAMRAVPRQSFVPPDIRARAYDDSALPIGFGLTISQPFIVAEAFTGKKGNITPLAETIRSFEEICDGKHDTLPEQAFRYVGGIDEAVEQGKRLTAEGK